MIREMIFRAADDMVFPYGPGADAGELMASGVMTVIVPGGDQQVSLGAALFQDTPHVLLP
jgi:hypothetical protein